MKELLIRKANYNNTSNQPNGTQSSSAKRDQMQKFVWIFQNQNDFCEFYNPFLNCFTSTLLCSNAMLSYYFSEYYIIDVKKSVRWFI